MRVNFALLLLLQTKRLLRRVSFLLILALIPLLTLAMANAAKEEAGVICVALAMENEADPVAAAVTERLLKEKSSVNYLLTDPATARQWVREGRADAAWIFDEETAEGLARYAQGHREPFVELWQRGEDSTLSLAKEQLHRAVFSHLSYELYRAFMLQNFPDIPEDRLRADYDNALPMEEILTIETYDGTPVTIEGNHLTVVLRGLLSLIVVLAGLAGALFAMEDHARGVFFSLSPLGRGVASLGAVLAAVAGALTAMGLALWLSGLCSPSLLWELLCLLLYLPAAAGFCLIYAAFFSRPRRAGVLLPFFAAAMLALSPVFLNLPALSPLQGFLPTYHYLYTLADASRLPSYLLYAVSSPVLGLALFCFKRPRLSTKS